MGLVRGVSPGEGHLGWLLKDELECTRQEGWREGGGELSRQRLRGVNGLKCLGNRETHEDGAWGDGRTGRRQKQD